jgi:hypothetical protein
MSCGVEFGEEEPFFSRQIAGNEHREVVHHTTLRSSSPAFWRGKKIVEHFLYVKETIELVPEHPH